MSKQCLHGNVRSHACDWHANYHIRRDIFLYCWNNCSSIKKFVLHSKKMFHTKNHSSLILFSIFRRKEWCYRILIWITILENMTVWHLNYQSHMWLIIACLRLMNPVVAKWCSLLCTTVLPARMVPAEPMLGNESDCERAQHSCRCAQVARTIATN